MRERKRKRIIFQFSSSSTRRFDQSLILLFSSSSSSSSFCLSFSLLSRKLFLRYSPSACLFFFNHLSLFSVSHLLLYRRLDYTSSSSRRLTSLLRSSLHPSAFSFLLSRSLSFTTVLHCIRPSTLCYVQESSRRFSMIFYSEGWNRYPRDKSNAQGEGGLRE